MNHVQTRPLVLSATSLIGNDVVNAEGENLGTVEELMIDLENGQISYAVLSFGGFMGMGDKLFALPWNALDVDTSEEVFRLDLDKEIFEDAPGFDKDNWPQIVTREWLSNLYLYYEIPPYWA